MVQTYTPLNYSTISWSNTLIRRHMLGARTEPFKIRNIPFQMGVGIMHKMQHWTLRLSYQNERWCVHSAHNYKHLCSQPNSSPTHSKTVKTLDSK